MQRVEDYTKFKDIHKGETCVIVANGPSLDNVPVDFLKRYITFGMNRITAKTPDFVPTYYACLGFNQLDTPEKRATIYPTLDHPDCKAAFINRDWAHMFPYDNTWSIKGISTYDGNENAEFFSLDPLHILGLRATMVFPCLQIAYYMGFTTVLLVGLDHEYPVESTKKHFYDDSEFPDFETAPGPVYGDNPLLWQAYADMMFAMANEVFNDAGREIINITGGSRCEIFRKEAFSAWYDKSK